jgi:hypothetical protein
VSLLLLLTNSAPSEPTDAMIATTRLTVSRTVATELYTANADTEIYLKASDVVYVGPAGVTADTGLPIGPTDGVVRFTLASSEALYAIAASRPGVTGNVAVFLLSNT